MPEGDTIHRIARRMNAAFDGREIALADAPSPRSPIHNRASELRGRTFEGAEARGKHLLVHFSGGVVLHSHLGMNGRWRVAADGRAPSGRPWIRIGSGPAVAAQTGGKLLRLVSESRARNDPGLLQLGPDPLRPGFDAADAVGRLLAASPRREVGDALLDQRLIAGIGNAIRNEACFAAQVSPFRRIGALERDEALAVVQECRRIMLIAVESGRRPHQVYRAERRPCPRCGGRISVRAQGDGGRIAYWCPQCQR
jgi:endonuclease VIII